MGHVQGCVIEETAEGLKITITPEMEFSKFGQLFSLENVVSVTADWNCVTENPEYGLNCIKIFDECYSVKRTILGELVRFEACVLTAEDFEDAQPLKDVCSIGKKNVPNTKVERLILPESMMEISSGIFKKFKHLKHIHVPDQLYWLSGIAFDDCEKLETASIPECVRNNCRDGITAMKDKTVGFNTHQYGLFSNCPSLEEVEVRGTCTRFRLTLDENGKMVNVPSFLVGYDQKRFCTRAFRLLVTGYPYSAIPKLLQFSVLQGYCKMAMEKREMSEEIALSYSTVVAKQKKTLCRYTPDVYVWEYLVAQQLVDGKTVDKWIKEADKKRDYDVAYRRSLEYLERRLQA